MSCRGKEQGYLAGVQDDLLLITHRMKHNHKKATLDKVVHSMHECLTKCGLTVQLRTSPTGNFLLIDMKKN